jgi:hypothetical protein
MDKRDRGHPESIPGVRESHFAIGTRVYIRDQVVPVRSETLEVAEVLDDGYLLRRISDETVIPHIFAFDEVRRERRINPWRNITGSYRDRRH